MGSSPLSAYERMRERTGELESAFYGLLEACDAYLATARSLLAEVDASGEPRPQLVHRLRQLSGNVERITRLLEDDALTLLLPVVDRLFAIERAEAGTDI